MAASAALLFTDVVDSTQITQRLGDVRAAARGPSTTGAHAACSASMAAARWVVPTGFCCCSRPRQTRRVMQSNTTRNSPKWGYPRARMHVGPIVLRETSDDDVALGAKHTAVEGLALPVAAR